MELTNCCATMGFGPLSRPIGSSNSLFDNRLIVFSLFMLDVMEYFDEMIPRMQCTKLLYTFPRLDTRSCMSSSFFISSFDVPDDASNVRDSNDIILIFW